MTTTLSEELNNLTNKEKIKFTKLLKTFKGDAHSSLEVAKSSSSNIKDENKGANNNQQKRGLVHLIGGFLGERLQALKNYVSSNNLKKTENITIQKAGSFDSNNTIPLVNAINKLNNLLETNQTNYILGGGSLEDKRHLVNEKKKSINSKNEIKVNRRKKKKKSLKKSVKPKKKTYKNKNKK